MMTIPAQQTDSRRSAGPAPEPATLSEALFASNLQSSQHPDAGDVREAIDSTLRALGVSQCAARVAQEFGDHPDTAIIRLRWAIGRVASAYAPAK